MTRKLTHSVFAVCCVKQLIFIRMKKKIFSGVFALALLATVGFGDQKSMKSDAGLSDLALVSEESSKWNH